MARQTTLGSAAGMEGIGLHEGQPCIKVFVAGPIQPLEGRIPNEVDGHCVILEQTGRFQARDPSSSLPRDTLSNP